MCQGDSDRIQKLPDLNLLRGQTGRQNFMLDFENQGNENKYIVVLLRKLNGKIIRLEDEIPF